MSTTHPNGHSSPPQSAQSSSPILPQTNSTNHESHADAVTKAINTIEQHHLILPKEINDDALLMDNNKTPGSLEGTILQNNYSFKIDEKEFSTRTHRILSIDSSPKLPYSDENRRNRNALHWGQRKLLLSEIEFLTEYSNDGDVVIYAGAAPGSHLVYLAEVLFPNLKFMLVDPNKFNEDLFHIRNVTIMESYFTDEIALEIKKIRNVEERNNLLFISDIRTADPLIMDPEQNEKCIEEDLSLQKGWLEILIPRFSMLKFRLPFTAGTIKYFKGDIYLPVWGRKWTTECRLVIKEEDIKSSNEIEYDNLSFSDQLFYFNNVTRFDYIYPHDICSDGVDNCYDCRSEILILQNFIKKFPQRKKDIICTEEDSETMNENEFISLWMADISHQISTKKRTLVHMPDTSIFHFGPTIHLHPQQQNSKEWLDMRNMVLERTRKFSNKVHSKHHASTEMSEENKSSHEQHPPLEMESTTVSNSPQLGEEQVKKKRRRRKKKASFQ